MTITPKREGKNRASLVLAILLAGLVIVSPGLTLAPAERPLSEILADLARFEHGADDTVLLELRSRARAMRRDPSNAAVLEDRLLAFLDGPATTAGRQAVCDELRLVGTERSVPVLERMLADPGTSDMALMALGGIPGGAADGALLRALDSLRGSARLGVISALGARRCAAAVPKLGELLAGPGRREAAAAADALGAIGGGLSVLLLDGRLDRGPAGLRLTAASALLACADGLLRSGDRTAARSAFHAVMMKGPDLVRREAGFRGVVRASGPDGARLVLEALAEKRPDRIGPAIDLVPSILDATMIPGALALLPELPEDARLRLVAALASFPKDSVRAAVRRAVEDPLASVRVEALRTLGRVGGASDVAFLAARAAGAGGAEQGAAREGLGRLDGPGVDEAFLDGIAGGNEGIARELVKALGERGTAKAGPVLRDLVRSGPGSLRLEAVRTLVGLGGGEDTDGLLDLLLELEAGPERDEIARAAAAAAAASGRPGAKAEAVESRLSSETDPGRRAALLEVLGMIGEDGSLPLVRDALADGETVVVDAAVRSISAWPTPVARDDALRIARTSSSLVHRVLALEGYVRMVLLEPQRAPDGAVASLASALTLAERPEEKRLVLGALPTFPCREALALASSLEAAPDVGPEARAASALIRERLAARPR